MYFKKIEMIGFKSFADKTSIEFNGGFTAIVGPNGCGKSNVSDAIRWVLGEQSAKSLRGDNMQDVIFKGTEKRRSLSYCEVTLTFDNTDRFFNISYDELSITRKLYRSGESEYQINKNTCRLKDITDLLFDSGIGKNGYSVIGQGKVSEIVDEKPEERRAMFEEAAGIAKFKSRKDEAERKLERTRDNLVRIDDIIAEIERQMGPLKKQAEDAKKYLEYKGQLKDLEVNAYIFQYENANTVKAEINQRLTALAEELDIRQKELEETTTKYDAELQKLSTFDKEISALNDELLRVTVEIEKQEGEVRVIREKINYTQKENDRLHLDLSNAGTVLKNCEETREIKQLELDELNSKLETLKKTYAGLSNKHLEIVDEMTLSENEAGLSQQKFIDTLGSLSDVKSNASRYEAEKNILKENLENLQKNLDEAKAKIESLQKLEKDTKNNVDLLSKSFNDLKEKCADISGKNFIASKRLKELETEKANIGTQIKVYENRRKLLLEMQAEFEGYAYSVKRILKESEKNSAVRSKMVGVLASLIKVPAQFETAVEVALGAGVQNIVTFNENGAKDLINYLKENKFGRATFLPINSMKRRDLDERMVAGKKGVFGVASKLIEYDKQIDNVISNLLGATVIVDTLATAVDLAKDNHFSFKIVTLDGDVVSTQGSLTGGSKKSEAVNLISRQREIETLATEIEKLQKNDKEIADEIEHLKSDIAEYSTNENEFLAQRNDCEIRLVKEQEKLDACEKDLEEALEEEKVYDMEKTSVQNKINLIEKELGEINLVKNALSGNKEDADLLIKQKQEKSNALRAERDEIVSKMTTIKVEIASSEEKINNLTDELDRLIAEIDKQNVNSANLTKQIAENDAFILQAEEMIKVQIENAGPSSAKDNMNAIRAKREKLEEEKGDISSTLKKYDETKTQILESISKINDRKYREDMNLSKVDSELEAMQERIYEEYNLTYSTCLEHRRPDFDYKEASIEINKLKKDISALGYVNVHAIEDVATLLDRYNDMSTQSADLKKAEEDLVKIIKDLSGEMLTKFNEEFEKINSSFKVVFRELFGGGNAKLELTESEDPLLAGVEIMVQLPGKAPNKLSLLSGGEKTLTAIALLFAILRLKPLPFSLLDEIEAALDDANIERFALYLKKLSESTQFIVITHRKPTMELADSLYGVTMEEKGVSKIVSVKLADAIKQAEQAN